MCGIAGIIRFDTAPVDPVMLHHVADTLRHRGPDGFGFFTQQSPPIGLAHARLKVIDLQTGDQPMFSDDATLVIVFNGEIYNFRELRAELVARGHIFRTQSDTEVILSAYREWGEAGVERIDGMFAFALWNKTTRQLLLARDRVGKKPLFIYRDDRQLAFASELKALLTMPDVDASIDPAAFPRYLTYGYVPTPGTFYRRIRKLPPATTLTVDADGTTAERTYWTIQFGGDLHDSRENPEATLRELLSEAVRKRMVADVPVGAFLSGGLDSTIVAGLMSEASEQPIRTFSIGFSGAPDYDETRYARMAAQHFNTEHTEFMVDPDALEILGALVDAYDEPFGDSSGIPTSILSKLTRSQVTVALTGDGGDELFAGYLRFHAAAVAERMPVGIRRVGRSVSRLLPANGSFRSWPARTARFLAAAAEPLPQRYLEWVGVFPSNAYELIRPEIRSASTESAFASFDRLLLAGNGRSSLARILTLNFHTYLLDDLLVKADRCSMMHSLELRSPFLDTRLIEFAAQLPDHMLYRNGTTKHVLREAFKDFVPEEILRRGKMGFGVPLDSWFRTRWRALVEERLLQNGPLHDWLDQKAVAAVVSTHMSGQANYGHRIWALLTLQSWLTRQREPIRC